jgi:hypothetical protein
MPRAALPTTPRGWLVALAAALIGLIAGFLFIAFMNRTVG